MALDWRYRRLGDPPCPGPSHATPTALTSHQRPGCPHPALPPRLPGLNPVGNVWQFLRDNWLSNRIFSSYEDILHHFHHCGQPWNKLASQPERTTSIGTRSWVPAYAGWYNTTVGSVDGGG